MMVNRMMKVMDFLYHMVICRREKAVITMMTKER